jgi:hypothetical protein
VIPGVRNPEADMDDTALSVAIGGGRSKEAAHAAPEVTVVIPAYNAETTIAQALASALTQEGVSTEVIVVDDGSADATPRVVDEAARTAGSGRVRLLSHPSGANRGVAASRNLALAGARAPFVAFLDADDWFLPDSLAKRMRAMREHRDAVLVYGRIRPAWSSVDQSEFVGFGIPARPMSMVTWLLFENPIPTSAVMVRMRSVPEHPFPEHLRHQIEDWAAWLAICRRGKTLFIDEELAVYRRTPASWSTRLEDRRVRHAQLREEAELLRLLADHDLEVPRTRVAEALAYRSGILLVEALGQLARLRVPTARLCLDSALAVAGSSRILAHAAWFWMPRIKARGWFPRRDRAGPAWNAFTAS